MINVKLINNTKYSDALISKYVRFSMPKNMPKSITVEVADIWFEDDEKAGERKYNPDVDWDGTAYPHNKVDVILSNRAPFPFKWIIDGENPGIYVEWGVFNNAEEYFVYTLAHEFRHLWQWKNPRIKKMYGDEEGDDETDADLYAILKLNQWRRKNRGKRTNKIARLSVKSVPDTPKERLVKKSRLSWISRVAKISLGNFTKMAKRTWRVKMFLL